jgi:DNA-binding transcriptional ArsR family regulator
MMDYREARAVAELLAAVAEPTRARIVWHLTRGPHHVGRIAELVGVPMVNASHHLGILRQAGLIEDEKDGRRVVYRLVPGLYAPGDGGPVIGTLTLGGFRLAILREPEPPDESGSSRDGPRRPRRRGPVADA